LILFYHSRYKTKTTITLKENMVFITNVFYIPSDSTIYIRKMLKKTFRFVIVK